MAFSINIFLLGLLILQTEQERIENLGGCVMWVGSSWRVDGHLSVSRAIGKHNTL